MNNNDIKEIGESLNLRHSRVHEGYIIVDMFGNVRIFNPDTNAADSFMVLEAYLKLIDEQTHKDPAFDIHHVSLEVTGWRKHPKEAICTAYLTMIRGE
jgi:hypothetical protein